MDTLKNKRYANYDYTARYTTVPYYYDTLCDKEIYGIGTNMKKDAVFATHTLISADTLESLSLKYYANPTYWWVIAYFNDIQDPFIKLKDYFDLIRIPRISAIEFGNERII